MYIYTLNKETQTHI